MNVYRIGATEQEENIVRYYNNIANSIPFTRGTDVTSLTQAQFLRAITGREVRGFGASDSVLAFTPPTFYGVGSLVSKIKETAQKIKDAIKETFQKLTNWIFKGAIQKVAPLFIYAFVKTAPNEKIARKQAKQLRVIDFIAKATGSTRETVLTVVATEITKLKGKTPAQLLNAVAGKTIAGDGKILQAGVTTAAAAIGIPPGITALAIDIIRKIIQVFKKKDSEAPEMTEIEPSASDFEGLNIVETPPISTPQTTAPTQQGARVLIPTPQAGGEVAPPQVTPMPQATTPTPPPMPQATTPTPQAEAEPQAARNDVTPPEKGNNNTLLIGGAVVLVAFLVSRRQSESVGLISPAGKRLCQSGARTTAEAGACAWHGGLARRGAQGRLAL